MPISRNKSGKRDLLQYITLEVEVNVPARYNKAGQVIGEAFTYMKPKRISVRHNRHHMLSNSAWGAMKAKRAKEQESSLDKIASKIGLK